MKIEGKYEMYLEMDGDTFKRIRKVACISQGDIAEICRVSRATVGAFEADRAVSPSTKLVLWTALDNLVHEKDNDIILNVWRTFTGIY